MTIVARPASRAGERSLAWPVWVLFAGYPAWWLLGMSQFIWPIVGGLCVIGLVANRRLAVPRSCGMWLLFLALMVASVIKAQHDYSLLAFVLRAALYFSATALGLWVYNCTEKELPVRSVVNAVTLLWLSMVGLGLLALLYPTLSFATPLGEVMPRGVTANSFVQTFLHPSLAERQLVFGHVAYRLRAPFTYSNEWGSFFALLTPFVIVRLSYTRHRVMWTLLLALSVVPAVLSLNRIMWLSLAVAAVVAGVQLTARGRSRPQWLVLFAVGAGVVFVSPLGRIIIERLTSAQSTPARASVVRQAIEGANASPWLGNGGPRPSVQEYVPAVGTQGQLWLVLFSHGYLATLLFVGFFVTMLVRTRHWRTPVELACHCVILISLVQLPFYNQNIALHVVFVAVGLSMRSLSPPVAAVAAPARIDVRRHRAVVPRAPGALVPAPLVAAIIDDAPQRRARHESLDTAVRRAASHGLANITASLAGGLLTLLTVVIVARERGSVGAGGFFVATALFAILSNVAELGADTGLLRSIPYDLVARDRQRLIRTLRVALLPPAVVATAAAIALAAAAGPIGSLVDPSGTGGTAATLRMLGGFLPFSVLASVLLAATRGFGTMGPTVFIERLGRSLLQCAGIAVAAHSGATAIGLAYGIPYLLAAVSAAMALRGLVAGAPDEGRSDHLSARALSRSFWAFAAPRALSAVAQVLIDRVDIVLVAGLASTAAAGVYSAATRLAIAGLMAATAVMQASQPVLTRMLARGQLDGARRIAQAATSWTVLVAWPVYGSLALLSVDVLSGFGTGFESGRWALVIVALGMLLATGVGPSEVTLLMSGGSVRAMVNTLVALTINVGANVVLIPRYGIEGAAFAWALSIAVSNAAAVLQVHSILGFLPFGRGWPFAALAVTAGLAAGYGAASAASRPGLEHVAWFAAAAVPVYALAVWIWRDRLELTAGGRPAARHSTRQVGERGYPAPDDAFAATVTQQPDSAERIP